jgi:hypothetical protein
MARKKLVSTNQKPKKKSSSRHSQHAGSILDNPGLLLHVLGYVGLGEHVFMAAVSKGWRQLYKQIPSHRIDGADLGRPSDEWRESLLLETRCETGMTLCSAAFASPARLLWAERCALPRQSARVVRSLGRCGGYATINKVFHRWRPDSAELMRGAAESGSAEKLEWVKSGVRKSNFPKDICVYAARSGSVELVRWLGQQGCLIKGPTARAAAERGHLNILQWMFESGRRLYEDTAECAALRGIVILFSDVYLQA